MNPCPVCDYLITSNDGSCEHCNHLDKAARYDGPALGAATGYAAGKDHRSDAAKARDEWLDSREGKNCQKSGILSSDSLAPYLKNRLESAFLAGMEAERRLQSGKRHSVPDQRAADGTHRKT